jgi:multidrug efflux pump subunit AcrA (membrane-fusion protein)
MTLRTPTTPGLKVLLCGFLDRIPGDWPEAPGVAIESTADPQEWLDGLNDPTVEVAALGADTPLDCIRRLLGWIEVEQLSRELPQLLLEHTLPDPELHRRLQASGAVYWVRPGLPAADREQLLWGALALQQRRRASAAAQDGSRLGAARLERLLGQLARAVKEDGRPERLEAGLVQALQELLGPVQVVFLRVDQVGRQLQRGFVIASEDAALAWSGLAGYGLRTNRTGVFADAERDPRYDAEVDGVRQGVHRQVVVLPLRDLGGNIRLLVVLSAPTSQWPTAAEDADTAQALVDGCAALFLPHIWSDAGFTQAFQRQTRARGEQQLGLYRSEALAARDAQDDQPGQALAAGPGWTRHGWRWLLGGAAALLLAGLLIQVRQYAEGPGVVRLGERIAVQAPAAGSVVRVLVQPGQAVAVGTALLELDERRERGQLEQAQAAFAHALRARLLAPADEATAAPVLAARNDRERAREALDQRTVLAPVAGVVSDLRLEPGQYVAAGRHLLALTSATTQRRIVALIPGTWRPRLHVGQPLRLQLHGYPMTHLSLTVARIGDDLVGPALARSLLGATREDTVSLSGSSVWVEADLEDDRFHFAGRALQLHDGLSGQVQIAVEQVPLLLQLLPGANAWSAR